MGVSDAWREHVPVVVREVATGWPSVRLKLGARAAAIFSSLQRARIWTLGFVFNWVWSFSLGRA
ncbi:hypothetical protein PVK06_025868 [Gossypium arboreum]|uniref:Uncharacterized protein n=1 Tax=Gossypium arboreum TaxID=29729 RepID=A0ABR0NX86_GOSAR|nr:hypothetical protein PVK06_025868 [Gossypium arboreum]